MLERRVYKVETSKIPNPLLQKSFHFDVHMLVVSSCFFMLPGPPSISGGLIASVVDDLPLLEI